MNWIILVALANSGSIWDSIREWNVTSVKPQGTGMSSSSGAMGSRPPDQGYSAIYGMEVTILGIDLDEIFCWN